ncbi:kinase-like protein [Auricularia subglabra TFB-10046 SS5]|nr:kinase-like protein [Auricularia subglabra TFB-10046 SS5]
MNKACFSELVLAQIGELKDALDSHRTDEIKRLGANCKAHQEQAACLLKHVQAWLRRQFVLRKLSLPNELDDACGRSATQLSQWISALDGIVAAYEAWVSDRAAAHPGTGQLPSSRKGEAKLWKFNKVQYRDLASSITVSKERKTLPESEWSAVYKGNVAHRSLKRPHETVAIKVYKWDNTAGENVILRRYREELEVRRTLVHPNILPLYGVATNVGHIPALVAPWCTPVKEYIISQRSRAYANPPVISILLNLLEQLLAALKYIHSQNVGCHGNLKGHNLLVTRDGKLQVCDFGVRFPRDAPIQLGTYRHQERASVAYLSPELIPRMRPTPESDMWAASCVFIEMVTGHAPYHGKGSAEEVVKEISSHKPPANRRPGEMTDELWKLVTRNFDRDSKKRLSASSMLTRLWILRYQDHVAGEPVGR